MRSPRVAIEEAERELRLARRDLEDAERSRDLALHNYSAAYLRERKARVALEIANEAARDAERRA